jgi:hypothetical protein
VSDLFLGVIAAAVLVMAIIQVAAAFLALRAARRVGDTVSRLERDVRPIVADLRPIVANLQPIVANLQTMSSDAARATRTAAAQIERADQRIAELGRRIDEMGASVRTNIVTPAREGIAVVQAVVAALASLRQPAPSPRKAPTAAEEEDALFIG